MCVFAASLYTSVHCGWGGGTVCVCVIFLLFFFYCFEFGSFGDESNYCSSKVLINMMLVMETAVKSKV